MQSVLEKTGIFKWRDDISLSKIANHYRGKVAITGLLLLGEAITVLMFPLAIGYSVDALLSDSYAGISALAALCIVVLVFAAGRRFYDTRVYAVVYREMATTLVERKRDNGVTTTKLTAQVNLLREIVEFFENSLPELIGAAIVFFGVVVMLGLFDKWVMASCLGASVLVVLIYALSENRIFTYNKHKNDELEKQVDILKENRKRRVFIHFGRIMKWNIKLSDLETLNYSAVWIVMALLLSFSIVLVVGNTAISYGQKITSIMYVFEYIEVVMSFPFFYQEIIRLKEITGRLSDASI